MAARRLLIVMLVLLGISSVIAVVVPEPKNNDPAPEESAVTGETGATGPDDEQTSSQASGSGDEAGEADYRTIDLDSKRRSEVSARAGGRMILTVMSATGSDVEIEGLGLTGFADPYAPAVFDVILPTEPGRYGVSVPGDEEPAAVIVTD